MRGDTELLVPKTQLGIATGLVVAPWDVNPVTVVLATAGAMTLPPVLWVGVRHRRSSLDAVLETARDHWGWLGALSFAGLVLYAVEARAFRLVFRPQPRTHGPPLRVTPGISDALLTFQNWHFTVPAFAASSASALPQAK